MRDKCQSQTPEREIEHIAYFSEQEGATLRLRLYVHKRFLELLMSKQINNFIVKRMKSHLHDDLLSESDEVNY